MSRDLTTGLHESYLVDLWEKEESQRSTEDAKGARNEEWVLARADSVGGVLLDDRENISSHKGSNLSNRRGV